MPIRHSSLGKNLKIIIAIIAVVILSIVIGLNIVVSRLNKEQYKAQFQEALKTLTGRELVIANPVRVGFIPSPYLEFSGLQLNDVTSNASAAPRMTIGAVRIFIPWLDAFSQIPTASNITIYNPSIDINRAEDGTIGWNNIENHIQEAYKSSSSRSANIQLNIIDGKIQYKNNQTSKRVQIDSINYAITLTQTNEINGQGSLLYKNIQTDSHFTFNATNEAPVIFALSQPNGNQLNFNGIYKENADHLQIEGKIENTIPDVAALFDMATPEEQGDKNDNDKPSMFDKFTQSNKAPIKLEKIAFSLKGPATISEDGLHIADTSEVQIGSSTGTLGADISMEQLSPHIDINSKFTSIDIAQWTPFFSLLEEASLPVDVSSAYDTQSHKLFTENAVITLNIAADNLKYGTKNYQGISMHSEISEGIFTLHELKMELPGESAISIFGVLSRPLQGLRFEGNIEIAGKALKDTLTFFDGTAASLPAQTFGEYSARASLFISREFMRLSEASLQIGDLSLKGGLVTYFEETPRVEAEIQFKDTNLDYFRDIWKTASNSDNSEQFKFFANQGANFEWLKNLGYIIDFKINFNNFTLLDQQGTTGAVRLYARKNELNLLGLHMNFANGPLDASFKLDVSVERPHIELTLNTPQFNTNYFLGEPKPDETPLVDITTDPKIWSEKLFDFSWMGGFTADLDFSTTQLTHKNHEFPNFKVKLQLKDQAAQIYTLSFNQFDGKVDMNGTFVGSKVPGASVNFKIYNIDVSRLFASIPGAHNLSGRMSINGFAKTSGIHFLSWVNHAEVKMVFAGRSIRVEGFNLDGILSAVQAARSTSDIVSSVNKLSGTGRTEFDIDGNINILRGVAKTPGIALKSGKTYGKLEGELDIIPWKATLSSILYFPQLNAETIPNMPINIRGPVSNLASEVDTSSLEAWASKRIVGQ